MSTGTTRMWLFLAAVFLAAALAGPHLACKGGDGGTGADGVDFAALVGEWKGTWEDTRYRKSGEAGMTVSAAGGGYEATGSIDLRQLGLGVRSGTAGATVDGGVLSFTFSAAGVGSGGGTVDGAEGAGSGTVTAPLALGAFTFSGTVAGDEITGRFEFSSPSGGRGSVALRRQ